MAGLWIDGSDAQVVNVWEKEIDREVRLRGPLLDPKYGFSGGTDKLIHIRDELTRGAGRTITYKTKYQMEGRGRAGEETLKGNGEYPKVATDSITVHILRHMVEVTTPMAQQWVHEDTWAEGKDSLADWFATRIEFSLNLHASGFHLVTDNAYTLHNTISELNSEYILRPGNKAAGALTAGDEFDVDLINDIALRIKLIEPQVRPVKTPLGDRYCLFLAPEQVRSLRKSDAIWFQTMQNALKGGVVDDNPLLSTALGQWNGMLIFESPLVSPGINAAGTGIQANTRRAWVGGANALTLAFGRGDAPEGFTLNRYKWIKETEDFGHVGQQAAMTIIGAKRPRFQHPDEASARECGAFVIETWADHGSLASSAVFDRWVDAGGGLTISS